MDKLMTAQRLQHETVTLRGRGGISAENRSSGFRPAFRDNDSGEIYASRFADGRLAPFHLIDGLPATVVVARDACGRPVAVKASICAGFVRDGRFYTREGAAQQMAGRAAHCHQRHGGSAIPFLHRSVQAA